MYAVTKYYANRAIKNGNQIINQIRNHEKAYKKRDKIFKDVKKNTKVISKIAKADRSNFVSYNLKKLLSMGLTVKYAYIHTENGIDEYDYAVPFAKSIKDWSNLEGQDNCKYGYNCYIHNGKNYPIITIKKYMPADGFLGYKDFCCKKHTTRRADYNDLRNAIEYFDNHYFTHIYGLIATHFDGIKNEFEDSIHNIRVNINYIKKHGLAHKHKSTTLKKLQAIKADCFSIQLRHLVTHYYSKTEYRYLAEDFNELKKLTAGNRDWLLLCNNVGISTVDKAIELNKHASTESSYEHMMSSYDVDKTSRDRKILPDLKKQHVIYVQRNSNALDGPEGYFDGGVASDNTYTVEPLQPSMIATLVDASRDDDILDDYAYNLDDYAYI